MGAGDGEHRTGPVSCVSTTGSALMLLHQHCTAPFPEFQTSLEFPKFGSDAHQEMGSVNKHEIDDRLLWFH